MDETLRCNSLPCRKALQLQGRAVSTSCSHIFCYDCATTLLQGRRICPACNTPLESPDDAIVTSLNPSASYKASVLAGLSPQIIMEICTRAIAFHHYQVTQEAAFQHMLLKKAQEAVTVYEREIERVELSAKTEITHLESRLADVQGELDEEKRRSREMRDAIRATGRDYEKLKTQFDHSKRNAIRNEIAGSVAGPVPLHMSTPRSSHAVTSIPQPFFAADTATQRSFHSPHPLGSAKLASNAMPLWNTPTRASKPHDGAYSLHSPRQQYVSQHRANCPNDQQSQPQGPPPAYHFTPNRSHSRPQSADPHRHSTVRAMPLPHTAAPQQNPKRYVGTAEHKPFATTTARTYR